MTLSLVSIDGYADKCFVQELNFQKISCGMDYWSVKSLSY